MGVVGQSRFGFQSWPCREVLQGPCKQAGKRSELLIYETLLDHTRKFSTVAYSNNSSKHVTCFCWPVRVQAVVGKPGETTRVHGFVQQCSDLCMLWSRLFFLLLPSRTGLWMLQSAGDSSAKACVSWAAWPEDQV